MKDRNNFVGNDGNLELVGDGQDLLDMLRGEAGTARVRGVIDKDGARPIRYLTFQVIQIDFPAFLRQ